MARDTIAKPHPAGRDFGRSFPGVVPSDSWQLVGVSRTLGLQQARAQTTGHLDSKTGDTVVSASRPGWSARYGSFVIVVRLIWRKPVSRIERILTSPAKALIKKRVPQREFDIDFDAELPPWEFFSVWQLAQSWRCSREYVANLVESGELPVGLDLRNKASSKSMIRVPRRSVVEFLNLRKDIAAVAEANPQPAFRDASKRRPKGNPRPLLS